MDWTDHNNYSVAGEYTVEKYISSRNRAIWLAFKKDTFLYSAKNRKSAKAYCETYERGGNALV
jgi:hypothetical protein